jgi:hypothetical protein
MLGKKRMIQAYDFLYSYYVEYDWIRNAFWLCFHA